MFATKFPSWSFDDIRAACEMITVLAKDPNNTATAIQALTLLNDRKISHGGKKAKPYYPYRAQRAGPVLQQPPRLG